jgi:hypothetical protein
MNRQALSLYWKRLKNLSKAVTPPITHLWTSIELSTWVLLRMNINETLKLKVLFNEAALIYTKC